MKVDKKIGPQVIALFLALFVPLNIALAIGESPDVYDMRYGLPVASSGERTYLTDELKVTVFFSQDAAVGVRYVRILGDQKNGITPENLSAQDVERLLFNHDSDRLGWNYESQEGQRRIWRRNDGGAIAFTEDNSIFVVFDSHNPPWWWREYVHDDAEDTVEEESPIDDGALREMSDEVIHLHYANPVTFQERVDVVNPDGSEVYVFQYKINDSEVVTQAEERTVVSYETISVQFHPRRGLEMDKAVISKGTGQEIMNPAWEEIWRKRPQGIE